LNTEISYKINGYLEGLSNLNTYFGGCYGNKYLFSKINQPIENAVNDYNKTSSLHYHLDVKFLPLRALDDWKETLFQIRADWFFSLYRMQDFQVKVAYFDDEENELPEEPAEFDKGFNTVSNRLIELLEQFIGNSSVKVFRLNTEVDEKNEFDWEQLYFVINDEVYVLEFYQWG
jgi:hypothetical protein